MLPPLERASRIFNKIFPTWVGQTGSSPYFLPLEWGKQDLTKFFTWKRKQDPQLVFPNLSGAKRILTKFSPILMDQARSAWCLPVSGSMTWIWGWVCMSVYCYNWSILHTLHMLQNVETTTSSQKFHLSANRSMKDLFQWRNLMVGGSSISISYLTCLYEVCSCWDTTTENLMVGGSGPMDRMYAITFRLPRKQCVFMNVFQFEHHCKPVWLADKEGLSGPHWSAASKVHNYT